MKNHRDSITIFPLVLAFYALAEDVSMLFDPGPSRYCWEYTNTADSKGTYNTTKDARDCSVFNGTGHAFPGSSWMTDQYGWEASDQKKYPGYDIQVEGTSGQPLTITVENNARTNGNCGATVFEIGFTYLYPAYSFTKQSDGWEYNLNDFSQILVDFDVEIISATGPTSSHSCPYQRNYFNADLIYYFNSTCHSSAFNCDATNKRALSLKLFDPKDDRIESPSDAKFRNNCPHAEFCEVMVNEEPRLQVGVKTHVSLDFKHLLNKWGSILNHTGDNQPGFPATAKIDALQIGTSNVENDSTSRISNITAIMRR